MCVSDEASPKMQPNINSVNTSAEGEKAVQDGKQAAEWERYQFS